MYFAVLTLVDDWEMASDEVTSTWALRTTLSTDGGFSDDREITVTGSYRASYNYHKRGAKNEAGRYLTAQGYTPFCLMQVP